MGVALASGDADPARPSDTGFALDDCSICRVLASLGLWSAPDIAPVASPVLRALCFEEAPVLAAAAWAHPPGRAPPVSELIQS